jgi:hypothetical protein
MDKPPSLVDEASFAALKCIALASGDVASPTEPIPEVLASGTILRKDTTVDIELRQGDPSGSIQWFEPMGLSTQVPEDCAVAPLVMKSVIANTKNWINFFILKNVNMYFIQNGRKYKLYIRHFIVS